MKKTTYKFVTFVTFSHPGPFFPESTTQEVTEFNHRNVKWPAGAYSFYFHERTDAIDDDGTTHRGKNTVVGPTYFHPDSKVFTLEQMEADPEAGEILIFNMRNNGWNKVVKCRTGNYLPFDDNCVLLS